MFKSIAHIGVAVQDMESATELFQKLFGKAPDHTENIPDQKVSTVMFHIGETAVELTAATDTESPIARFIEKRGEGVHHISFVVDDIEAELKRLQQLGFQLIDEQPRKGADNYRVAFLHPKSTNGVLIEISQKAS
ncbi:MAG TPA: methylmalonyl-CoA epimerase [Bacteroidota bacterium]